MSFFFTKHEPWEYLQKYHVYLEYSWNMYLLFMSSVPSNNPIYIMSTLTFVYLQALLHEFSAQQQKMREKQKMLKVHTSSTFGIW